MLPYHVKDYKPPVEEENKQEKILNPLQRALIKKLTSNFDCSTQRDQTERSGGL